MLNYYFNTVLQKQCDAIPSYSEIVEKLSNGGKNLVSLKDVSSAMEERYRHFTDDPIYRKDVTKIL